MMPAGRAILGVAIALAGCASPPAPVRALPAPSYEWRLPRGFPKPVVPASNPMSAAKVELGRHLFHDPRLSGNEGQSCASCHVQERAFTDGRGRAVGSTGALHPRGSMSLANVGYAATLTWVDSGHRQLESQALVPLAGTDPVEMGIAGREEEVLDRLRGDATYRKLFAAAFPGEAITLDVVTKAIASFERTLVSGRSAYDRLVWDDDHSALSPSAWRGMTLFFGDRLRCATCHGGFTFAGDETWEGAPVDPVPRALVDNGLGAGRFKAPTLRNIAVTPPYMHDGRLTTLDAVLDHYASGGARRPEQSPLVDGFALSADERRDVLAFLESLTDHELLTDPRLGDPWRSASVARESRQSRVEVERLER